ncbi:putative helicase MOV-10 [Neodiprion pinetum]|uniref:putative helicase MOV-10 n=1 Tax=Neodiprion pinetum TaxID=441929 RepID=UPI001EDF73D8|nr:putative helicase MOV-10 [Neodiprion pinetum]XP_046486557.1 putative helicase MOV-10 [Neodiprion pinetum]XP_046486559.1 putative helicase MOV-10 [Neodiprion pinetum]XP_046486560.1 putative helicase MOV-10 [Neodiprion pinetum]XP_046486561.1 putative helicase MOV-10 [Neodiprion pinetum]XP_046486562.1 putative helicase MOV-10 [Neodiprion pinetum]XP_046486563.1 putative helicase MOV-10 [Neodiprion pinetum]XP_046486564.1 putative helicase MOV-10 [Neodiprion pinetum]XP_046486565.1 putative hel
MSPRGPKKSGLTVVGMAPELKLKPYRIPKDLRKVFENGMKHFTEINDKQEVYLEMIKKVISERDIQSYSYINHLKLLLYMEEYNRELEMKMYDLKDQKIKKCLSGEDFQIYVPGLGEDRPSLQLYDEVLLRKTDDSNCWISSISFIGEKYVKIVAPAKFSKKFNEENLYDIKFLLPRRTLQCSHYAIELVEINQLVPALFPEIRTCYNNLSKELTWFDKNIATNVEQKQAIRNIIARTAHPAPYILFGPPGTGKTATLVEAISQIWKLNPSNHILICTPSNAAADEILKRLLKNIPEQDVYRMYGSSRNWDDVDEEIQPCSNFVDGEKIFLPKELLMLRRIVVVTLMSCARLLALKLWENHFAYVFIDEGGQATEPETLIPLGLMSSADSSHKGRLQGQLVIAGDPMQLGPSIAMRTPETLAKSMLERLMKQCSPYKKDQSGKYNPKYITKLVRNFRSNKFILHVPNILFYDDELQQCGISADINRALGFKKLINKSFPLIFHAVNGQECRNSNSPSIYNMAEINVIMVYLENLIGTKLGNRKLEQKDIGIITPYKLQRNKIHQELEKRNWDEISVGTVEIFQGQERDVIIMSTVRSLMVKHNGREHLGFLSNPKRFNVAITRAKSLLITVGNQRILQVDPYWDQLIKYCRDNNAYTGARFYPKQKLTNGKKKKLIAKKYVPQPVSDQDFQFPDIDTSVIHKFENCQFSENLIPRRRARMPRVNKDLASSSQFTSDSGVTSVSNSSSTTDSELQDTASNFSSTDGHIPPSKSGSLASISDPSPADEVLHIRSIKDILDASFDLDDSSESTTSSNEYDLNDVSLGLEKIRLSDV